MGREATLKLYCSLLSNDLWRISTTVTFGLWGSTRAASEIAYFHTV